MFVKKSLSVVLLFAALVVPALAVLPAARAQEGTPPLAYAPQGPHPVGARAIKVQAPKHATNLIVWYPAVYLPDQTVTPGEPVEDAAPDLSGGPYPLVIYVPGWTADRLTGQWLGDHLASYGFVVMAMDPIDVNGGGYSEGAEIYRRPQDTVWQLNYAVSLTAAGGALQGMIDMDHVAVTGHSLGGYTALMAGGARLDWSFFPTWCSQHHADSASDIGMNFCDSWVPDMGRWVASLAGLDSSQTGLWPSWGDPRVDAIVSLSPPYWMIIGPEGMKAVTVPMLMIGAADDNVVPPTWNQFYDSAGSAEKALMVFNSGGHVFYDDKQQNSLDPTRHLITAFLLATLKNDAEAAAALAPGALTIPDLEYSYLAQGF